MITTNTSAHAISWPAKFPLRSVSISATTYEDACGRIIQAAKVRASAIVDHMPVHGVVSAWRDPEFCRQMNAFDMVCPDGQPVRWALNKIHGTNIPDRVYGPDLMLLLCERAAAESIGVYLYGSTTEVLKRLKENLTRRFEGIRIAGAESPPFRELSAQEDAETVERINASGAGLVFIGLGCPRQEIFAYEHRERLRGVQMCVGAAFDFLAGTKPQAPSWMQKRGLEWLFRLASEPGRLWKRYAVTNTLFVGGIGWELVRRKIFS